jgi:FkbM family methyltransferase
MLRQFAKRLIYGYLPGVAGAFPYFGTRVYFPKRALIFDLACKEGIYEHELLSLIQGLITPGSWYFDVGANIGLMSVPILKMSKGVNVMSVEPSPNSQGYLRRTWSKSPWQDRWKVVFKAVGDRVGQTKFHCSTRQFAGYDGIMDTHRVPGAESTTVPLTTLDEEWRALGRPRVACVKLDVEGSEIRALAGARELVQSSRPHIFLEWYQENFQCFGHEASDLFRVAQELRYTLVALPNLIEIASPALLALHLRTTASFALVPLEQ